MDPIKKSIRDLVIANRILANEGIVDGYGHVSVRHPLRADRYLLSRSRSPELVVADDIMEFTLDGRPANTKDDRPPYLERFIHGAIYDARPEINSVVHSHSESVLPYSVTKRPLVPVFHAAGPIGTRIPVWDIRAKFGDTNLLVSCVDHGRDLAGCLQDGNVVLMRGHGFSAGAKSLIQALWISIYLPANARVLTTAIALGGEITALSDAEAAHQAALDPESPAIQRTWEYWTRRAGCAEMLDEK
ncbi:MAG: hypothetical protein JWQ07_4492 [Ramlibacter sp.]|nr:hypothetical protein [Ramlibacter sp.]